MLGAMGHSNIELAQAADKADCFLWPFCRRNLRCGPRVEAAGPGHLSQGGSVRSTLALENLSPDRVCRVPYPGLLPASKNKVWRDRAASYFPDRAFRGLPRGESPCGAQWMQLLWGGQTGRLSGRELLGARCELQSGSLRAPGWKHQVDPHTCCKGWLGCGLLGTYFRQTSRPPFLPRLSPDGSRLCQWTWAHPAAPGWCPGPTPDSRTQVQVDPGHVLHPCRWHRRLEDTPASRRDAGFRTPGGLKPQRWGSLPHWVGIIPQPRDELGLLQGRAWEDQRCGRFNSLNVTPNSSGMGAGRRDRPGQELDGFLPDSPSGWGVRAHHLAVRGQVA